MTREELIIVADIHSLFILLPPWQREKVSNAIGMP
jgi:hypothetical protein